MAQLKYDIPEPPSVFVHRQMIDLSDAWWQRLYL